jgi:hypothetical protein
MLGPSLAARPVPAGVWNEGDEGACVRPSSLSGHGRVRSGCLFVKTATYMITF